MSWIKSIITAAKWAWKHRKDKHNRQFYRRMKRELGVTIK